MKSPEDAKQLAEDPEANCVSNLSKDSACLHVVAVGASAGGLESLEKFFKAMPTDTGMAFVVLQHLSPDFKSLMDELLARQTSMTIRKAEDDMEVEANTIYLNPPRKNMIVSGGNIYLSEVDADEPISLPIDQFFRSLAQDYRRYAISIVLSGTGSDGSRGIRDIFEAGGLVLAETEETAAFDGMPRNAQETGCVHLVLPPDAMPEALVSYVNQSLSPQDFAEELFVPPRVGGMEAIFRLLKDEYGIDFSLYKPNTVVRRVERRISLIHSVDLEAYINRLEHDSNELHALYFDLLIGVTRFFRDTDAFNYIASDLLPNLVSSKSNGDELRVWIAGCATGEEAYSYAILIDEALSGANKKLDVKIFATDIHPSSLEFAGAGVYPEESFSQVDVARIKQYFDEVEGGFRIRSRLRQMVVFAKHNVFKDAPFTKLDIISCRNLLIYLQPLAQKKALSLFHFGLKPRGTLVLGPSESPGDLKEEFNVKNNRWKVYEKRRDVRLGAEIRLPLGSSNVVSAPQQPAGNASQRSLLRAYDQLLAKHIPAAFLIDENRNLIHVFGNDSEYLQPQQGRLSTDILDVIKTELKPTLGSLIQRIRSSAENQVVISTILKENGVAKKVSLRIVKLLDNQSNQIWYSIYVDEVASAEQANSDPIKSKQTISQAGEKGDSVPADWVSDRYDDMEAELGRTKENLQATVEELETSNEELQAINEEMTASNEELQSTNEELHSVNEELYTVNAEYQNKISELSELSNDMENLLESTEIGTVFLDEKLAIRKFTGKAEIWFNLVPRDIGRKINSFSHNLIHTTLHKDLVSVLESGIPIESEVEDLAKNWLHLRLNPYKSEGRVKGVVMTLIEISNLMNDRAKLRRLSAIVESSDDAIVGKSLNGQVESWNQAAADLFGFTAKEAIGKDISFILPKDGDDEALSYIEQIKRGESVEAIETQRVAKDGKVIEVALRFSPIRDRSGEVSGLSAVCRDITSQKQSERELERLAIVVKHTDNAVVLTDTKGRVDWVNEAYTRITGYTLEESLGKTPGSLLQGEQSEASTIALMRKKIREGLGFNVEIVNYHRNGTPYWVAIECMPMVDREGDFNGFMAIERDITKLRAAQADIRREVERRDDFLAMLSHELRNPLGAIKNGLVVLDRQDDPGSPDHREIEEVMGEQVEQMSRLLDDLLEVSRVTQNKVLIRRETIDLRDTARRAVDAVTPLAERHGCPLQLEMPDRPVYVSGDAARLQQVQSNLLTNAIRHSRRDDLIILRLEVAGSTACVSVIDVGEGISQEDQTRVFDLFYQVNSELARTEGGLGVGLSLVKDFVEKHEGNVKLASAGIGKGTRIEVTLPLVDRKVSSSETDKACEVVPMTIVVVEDHEANRKMLKSLLELDGHQVQVADTAARGIALIENERPDLAIVDIGLPDMPGYEVAKKVRQLTPKIKTLLVALTGYGQESNVENAINAGFDLHLMKPFDPSKLAKFLADKRSNK